MILPFKPFAAALLVTLLAAAPAGALANSKTKADEMAGAEIFRKQDCAHCHGEAGVGGKKAPALTDIRKDKAWPPEKITSQILNGGKKMPPFSEALTDDQVAQLVAYLRAKHKPALPPAKAGEPSR